MGIIDAWKGTGSEVSWTGNKPRSKAHRIKNAIESSNARRNAPKVTLPTVRCLQTVDAKAEEENS